MILQALFNVRPTLERIRALGDAAPPFPGVIAHHRAPGIRGLLDGHAQAFHDATVVRGLPATDFFTQSGIAATAEENGGVCSFRLGKTVALYQSRNQVLVDDDALAPSLDANGSLFGDFMGALPNADPRRAAKRRIIESTFGNSKYIEGIVPEARNLAAQFIAANLAEERPLDDFTLEWVAHVDSLVPGLFDFHAKPLTRYLTSAEYGKLARDFFDIASEVISKANPAAIESLDSLGPFVRALLSDNFECIAAAPATNIVRQSFALWGLPFERAAIASLDPAKLNELATIIVASYDTTCLSLLWAIAFVEANPAIKDQLTRGAAHAGCPFSVAELVALEAVRIGGSNPTALYRRVVRPFVLEHRGRSVTIPTGTMMWLDRRRANHDASTFSKACEFALDNVAALAKSERETVSSLLSRGRYEINSFSMINTERNPRKCPGRLFSVRLQAVLLESLYQHYAVATQGVDLALRDFSSMPRPRRAGTIRVTRKEG